MFRLRYSNRAVNHSNKAVTRSESSVVSYAAINVTEVWKTVDIRTISCRGKLLLGGGGGNLGKFGDSLQIRQSLTRQLLVAPEISYRLTLNLPKFILPVAI